jgi:Cysteine rich repeat
MSHALRRPRLATTIAALLTFVATLPAHAQSRPSQKMRSEAVALMQICRADYDRLCSGVTPGGGRVIACLQSHASQLGAACAQAMPRAEALRNSATAAGAMPK